MSAGRKGPPWEETAMTDDSASQLTELTAEIVGAYVKKNLVQLGDVSKLIGEVYASLSRLGNTLTLGQSPLQRQKPAVAVSQSVTPEFLICLEDGKPFKSLKRHLFAKYRLTPDEYRQKWGLPDDYPMVSPKYGRSRSKIAKANNLGKQSSKIGRRGHLASVT
jgi:predicted transcriptional regulator